MIPSSTATSLRIYMMLCTLYHRRSKGGEGRDLLILYQGFIQDLSLWEETVGATLSKPHTLKLAALVVMTHRN